MNNPSVRINFNFNAAPTDFPERRGRTQDGFGIALVFVKSFTDKFSRLASEEINNDFTVRNRLLFFREGIDRCPDYQVAASCGDSHLQSRPYSLPASYSVSRSIPWVTYPSAA